MKMINELNLLRTLSPLHVGSSSTIGVVDMPIQREQHTGFPKIDSSSLKGALRSYAYHQSNQGKDHKFIKIFGQEPSEKDYVQTGAISISESKILFFPIKSLNNVFAYITCPMVLNRFNQEINNYSINVNVDVPTELKVESTKALVSDDALLANNYLVLEEFTYSGQVNGELQNFAGQLDQYLNLGNYFTSRVALVTDDEFKQFVELSTEISNRIRIDPSTGSTVAGALFYEENLPAESILYTFIHYRDGKPDTEQMIDVVLDANQVRDEFNNYVADTIQLGGNASIGRGVIKRAAVEEG